MSKAIDGFFEPDGPTAQVVDRSTLERWATCPHQAAMIDRKLVTNSSTATDVGAAAHNIIAMAVKARSVDCMSPMDLREFIRAEAERSRPDIQPEVIRALRNPWPIVELICRTPGSSDERHPEDLRRYDGGDGEHAGQLAADLLPALDDGSRGPVRLTGEVDLLMATASKHELDLIDWKAGQKWWTATMVAESFQFQFYTWVVFANYPEVERVRTRVFMTREGEATAAVEFTRAGLPAIHQRLLSAAGVYLKHHATEDIERIPAWPTPDKCVLCDAARYCHLAHKPAKSAAVDPEGAARQLVVLDVVAGQLRKDLTTIRRSKGVDLDFGDVCFGTDKPKAARAPMCDVYEVEGRRTDFGKAPEPAAV